MSRSLRGIMIINASEAIVQNIALHLYHRRTILSIRLFPSSTRRHEQIFHNPLTRFSCYNNISPFHHKSLFIEQVDELTRRLHQPRRRNRELDRLRRTHSKLLINIIRILITIALPRYLILDHLRLPFRRRLDTYTRRPRRSGAAVLLSYRRAEDLRAQLRRCGGW